MLPVHEASPEHQGIYLTERAIEYVKKRMKTETAVKGIRLGTRKAGCSGLKYELEFVMTPDEQDLCFPVNEEISIYVAKDSYLFLKGSVIDYVREGVNTVPKVMNPNEKGSCGCGESFQV